MEEDHQVEGLAWRPGVPASDAHGRRDEDAGVWKRASPSFPAPKAFPSLYPSLVAFFAWTFAVYDFLLFGLLLPVLATEFGWSPAQSVSIAFRVAIASFLCSLLVGPIADRFGRRNALVITVGGAALSSALTALAAGPLSLIFARALSGLGYSEQAVNTVYLSELEPAGRRGRIYGFVQGGWPIGQLLATGATGLLLPLVGWRGVFFVASFPALAVLLARLWLPESPHFRKLQRFRRLLRHRAPEVAARYAQRNGIDAEKSRQISLIQLLGPDLRFHFLFLVCAFFFNWFAGQIFTVLATTVFTQAKGLSYNEALYAFGAGSAAAYVGYVFHGYLGDLAGRRETVAIAWIASALAYAALLFFARGFWPVASLYAIADFLRAGAYSALFTYIAESFPTRVRGNATALINAIGPLGAIASSSLFSLALGQGMSGVWASFWIGALPALLSGLFLLGCRSIPPGLALEAISR
ncbi:Permease of the major facilitator superfamily [Methylacidimicrobium sp. AP8]|uniref:MFS transporter n=1 Tax=Methylacidimicrobium sp. AP8 TaxID=2730359 RepID=UPI0018C0BD92|nr:MFS transporter [Methylacidimicrobium sp. AP8]CAB4242731.1 Permease of the major facilitator superfamily [Methylacidimicrobium sp. AP8]